MTTPPGDQSPYEQPQYPPAGQPQYAPPGGPAYGYQPGYPSVAPPEHPKAMTSMVLGLLGLFLCQLVSPFAWSIGKRTLNEIDASSGRIGGRGQAQAGYILGIIGTLVLGLGVLFALGMGLLLLVFGVAGVAQTGT